LTKHIYPPKKKCRSHRDKFCKQAKRILSSNLKWIVRASTQHAGYENGYQVFPQSLKTSAALFSLFSNRLPEEPET
jgi:hypothetical protein